MIPKANANAGWEDSNDVKGARGWREGSGRKMGWHLFVAQSCVIKQDV